MINSIQTKNTLTFLLLNTVELLSATWFIFSTIRLFSIKYWSFDGGQTFNVACILACLVVCFVVLLSLFGFLTSYKSNSKMYLAVSSDNFNLKISSHQNFYDEFFSIFPIFLIFPTLKMTTNLLSRTVWNSPASLSSAADHHRFYSSEISR